MAAAVAEGKALNSSDGAFASRKRLIILMCDTSGEEMIQRKRPRSLSGNRNGRGEGEFCFVRSAFCKSTLRESDLLTGLCSSDRDPFSGVVRLLTRDQVKSSMIWGSEWKYLHLFPIVWCLFVCAPLNHIDLRRCKKNLQKTASDLHTLLCCVTRLHLYATVQGCMAASNPEPPAEMFKTKQSERTFNGSQ